MNVHPHLYSIPVTYPPFLLPSLLAGFVFSPLPHSSSPSFSLSCASHSLHLASPLHVNLFTIPKIQIIQNSLIFLFAAWPQIGSYLSCPFARVLNVLRQPFRVYPQF